MRLTCWLGAGFGMVPALTPADLTKNTEANAVWSRRSRVAPPDNSGGCPRPQQSPEQSLEVSRPPTLDCSGLVSGATWVALPPPISLLNSCPLNPLGPLAPPGEWPTSFPRKPLPYPEFSRELLRART